MSSLLALFGKKQADDPIANFIRDSSQGDPNACSRVASLGAGVVEQLIPLCAATKKRPLNLRINAIRALGQIGDARAVDPLIGLLQDAEKLIRIEAATALGQLHDPRAIRPLIEILGTDYALSSAAARSLGRLGDSRAVTALIHMLDDCYECGREAAAEALGRLHDERAVPPLVKALNDEDSAMRKIAAESLAQIGWQPDSAESKVAYLVARQSWAECAQMGSAAVPQLIKALRSNDFETAFHAGNILAAIGESAVEPLRASLNSGNFDFRADVTRILDQIAAQHSVAG
ncbi:MAG: HEAT repeat domain-containing protein [Chloroflexi bacterium]|nr:HEAT repeat domain-containing protein [Chloroflexota bacterium]MCL5275984.1 HEAT repeat domain-containing protein [Chloroflexota bacterium]